MKSVVTSLAKVPTEAPTGIAGIDEITGGGLPHHVIMQSSSSPPRGNDLSPRADSDLVHQALRISESRYRRLFETARDGILILNADTAQIEDVNPYLIEMLGYSHAEFLRKKLWEVGPFVDIPQSKEMFAELKTQGYVRYDGLPLKTRAGTQIEVEFVSNSYDCDGIKVIQCNIRDITESKRAEKELRASEARFRSLSQMSSDFYWESDVEHRFTLGNTDANVNVASLWRTPIGKRRWEMPYLSPDEASWQAHRALMDAHRPFRDFLLSRPDPDGTERYLSVSGDPVFDVSGAFKGYRGVGTDITERKQAEKALRDAAEQFRAMVEQSIAGTYIIQDGKFAYVNPRFAKIFGYDSAQEVIDRDVLSLVAEKDRGTVAERARRRTKGKLSSVNYEFAGLRKDGSMIDVDVHGARATHRGRPAVIGLIQDISEKKRADEDILRYVEQLKTAFMSTVEVATIISEMRDPYTAGHERRVAGLAVAIGAELGFDARRQEALQVAGHLHDIGKITIPAEILSKPGKLSATEFQLVQGHAQASYDVLKGVEFPWPVAQIALQHHERMDGSGYPQGLKGEAILLEARILAVADVVEAMSSHRPYRPGLGIVKALAEIERGRGTAYDCDAADACLRLFREKRYQFPA